MYTVPDTIAMEPQTDVNGAWAVCSPETVGSAWAVYGQAVPGFSAVGYFFARDLWNTLQVPIGIIHTSWGGTPAESWTDEASLQAYPALQKYVDFKQQHLGAGDPLQKNPGMPTGLYNAMIAPLIPYAIRGAIWYQGESNEGDAATYRTLFPAMIQGWRRNWGEGDFPFLFVQIANYMSTHPEPTDTGWAQLREAQTMTLRLPNTGMAVIIDVGDAADIHPKDKQDVGHRLAVWAESMVYGQKVVPSGPLYDSMQIEGSALRLHFRYVDGGLVLRSGPPARGFAIAGADGKFVWADATIDGDTIVVSSPQVPHPTAVRYDWDDNPVGNLYNWALLPASPFRTDAPEAPKM
jgi:sialate O-acetylesterase